MKKVIIIKSSHNKVANEETSNGEDGSDESSNPDDKLKKGQ